VRTWDPRAGACDFATQALALRLAAVRAAADASVQVIEHQQRAVEQLLCVGDSVPSRLRPYSLEIARRRTRWYPTGRDRGHSGNLSKGWGRARESTRSASRKAAFDSWPGVWIPSMSSCGLQRTSRHHRIRLRIASHPLPSFPTLSAGRGLKRPATQCATGLVPSLRCRKVAS